MFALVEKNICPLCGQLLNKKKYGFACPKKITNVFGTKSHFRVWRNKDKSKDYGFSIGNIFITSVNDAKQYYNVSYMKYPEEYTTPYNVESYELFPYFDFSSEEGFLKKLEIIKVFS